MSGPAFAIAKPLVAGATQAVTTGTGFYRGIVVRETSAAALVLRIWDNASAASGTLLDVIVVAANARADSLPPTPIQYVNGIYIERVSGTNYEGSIRLA